MSVIHLENFEGRLEALSSAQESGDTTAPQSNSSGQDVKMIDIETKLFVDEFFDIESKEIVKKDF